MRSTRRLLALIAIALGALISLPGCGASAESCKEAERHNAFHASCDVIRWHERHEGPTIYNNFHSTKP